MLGWRLVSAGGSERGGTLHAGFRSSSCAVDQRQVYKLWVDEREPCELCLVDVGDDQLIWRCELGLGAGEELVKVLRSFAALW